MCDYSLHHVASRPARVGDRLVITQFSASMTRGFAAISEMEVAVCLRPGTEIVFDKEAEYWHPFARLIPSLRFGKLGGKLARFRQINMEKRDTHHDALEFADGTIILLTRLRPGQRATVLQMPVDAPLAETDVRESDLRLPSHNPEAREVVLSPVRASAIRRG